MPNIHKLVRMVICIIPHYALSGSAACSDRLFVTDKQKSPNAKQTEKKAAALNAVAKPQRCIVCGVVALLPHETITDRHPVCVWFRHLMNDLQQVVVVADRNIVPVRHK